VKARTPEEACAYFLDGRCSAVELGAKPLRLLNSADIQGQRFSCNIPLCGETTDDTGRPLILAYLPWKNVVMMPRGK